MIKFQDQVPSIYTSASRDFQYLGWLINIVLNAVKHNVDDIYDLPDTKADPRLTELLALTLGFKVRRSYDQKQLAALVSIIPTILKNKGTARAITLAGEALVTASGAVGEFSHEVKDNCLKVILPKELIDVNLFTDLLPYILPAGMTCHITRQTQVEQELQTITVHKDTLRHGIFKEELTLNNNDIDNNNIRLSVIYDDRPQNTSKLATRYAFANYDNKMNLNAGLLDNSVIPVIEQNTFGEQKDEENDS